MHLGQYFKPSFSFGWSILKDICMEYYLYVLPIIFLIIILVMY